MVDTEAVGPMFDYTMPTLAGRLWAERATGPLRGLEVRLLEPNLGAGTHGFNH